MNLIYLLILSNILLFQSPRSVQTINLSHLCGRFGHACYGANWGKRETPEYLTSDKNENENPMANRGNTRSNLEEFRLKLFLLKLRQLFK